MYFVISLQRKQECQTGYLSFGFVCYFMELISDVIKGTLYRLSEATQELIFVNSILIVLQVDAVVMSFLNFIFWSSAHLIEDLCYFNFQCFVACLVTQLVKLLRCKHHIEVSEIVSSISYIAICRISFTKFICLIVLNFCALLDVKPGS